MDKTQVKAEFFILSNTLTGIQLTEKIGSKPEKSGDKEEILKSGKMRGYSFWEISTDYENSLDINEQINRLIPIIEQNKSTICGVIENGEGEAKFCIVVVIERGNTPAMMLKKDFIELLYELKAEIEFDTYANPYEAEME